MKTRKFLLAGLVLLILAAFTTPEDSPSVSQMNANIDQMVNDMLKNSKIPGLTVAVTKKGKLVFNKGYGYADYKNKKKMKQYHRTKIGSVSKIITTLGAMKLSQQNPGFKVHEKLYGVQGLLKNPAYTNAFMSGVKRHRPILSIAIAGSNDRVYTWSANKKVCSGFSADLDKFSGLNNFSLPPGKTINDIRAIAIAGSNDKTYVWYDDGSRSCGTTKDLDKYFYKPVVDDKKAYSLPSGKSIAHIVGIGIAKNDRVYVWYDDGTVSSGTTWDFDKYSTPKKVYLPAGKKMYDIRGMGIAGSNDHVYTWFSDGTVSSGTSTDLDKYKKPYKYTLPNYGSSPGWGLPGELEMASRYGKMELRHILSHTAGFVRSGDGAAAAKMFNISEDNLTYEQIHLYMLTTRKVLFEPGQSAKYSNHGVGLAGHITSVAAGKSYVNYIRSNILNPLGLNKVIPNGTQTQQNSNYYANPHYTNDNGQIIKLPLDQVSKPSTGTAAGGWSASAKDLARIMVATDKLMNHSDIIQPNTIDLMETKPFPNVTKSHALGWGFNCKQGCSMKKLSHSGLLGGGNAYIAKFSTNYVTNDGINIGGINIAICTNTGDSHTGALKNLSNQIVKEVGKTFIPSNVDLF